MNSRDLLNVAMLGAIAYLVYKLLNQGSQVANYTADKLAQLWLSWSPWALPPDMTVLGNIVLPDGTLVPLSSVTVKTSPEGGAYARIGTGYYVLQPSDADGNWPALLVS